MSEEPAGYWHMHKGWGEKQGLDEAGRKGVGVLVRNVENAFFVAFFCPVRQRKKVANILQMQQK